MVDRGPLEELLSGLTGKRELVRRLMALDSDPAWAVVLADCEARICEVTELLQQTPTGAA